jgi:glutathione S-transferase
MKLYTNPLSPNCRKILGVAAHAGVDIDVQPVDLLKGAQKQPDFLAINPNGKVPALVDGDVTLWESNAITCYVASKAESDLWPKSNQRYDILRWMFWESNHWSKAIGTIIGQKIFNAANPDQAIIDNGLADFHTFASVLDDHLASRDFVSGEALTVADFALAVWLGYSQICELPLSEFDHIRTWNSRLNALPAWGVMHPPQPKAA